MLPGAFKKTIVFLVQSVIIISLAAHSHSVSKILAIQLPVVLVSQQKMFYIVVGDVNILQTVVIHFQYALKDSVY